MTVVPETKYAKSGDFHIAYQAVGTGPPDLVFMHGWISHIEHMWEEPRMARFLDRLASFARLIVLDKRGTGLSDPVPLDRLPTLEERMDDLRAVMDAVGSERAALMGTSEAGALSLLFAATYPSRTAALVLLNSYARLAYAPDYPHGIAAEQAQGLLQAIEEGWGKGVAFEALIASQADNAPMKSWWSRYQRLAASPGTAVTLLRSAFETDARHVLPAITVPVLILHRAGDPFTGPEHGRYLAERIPSARFVELSGVDHLFFALVLGSVDACVASVLPSSPTLSEPLDPRAGGPHPRLSESESRVVLPRDAGPRAAKAMDAPPPPTLPPQPETVAALLLWLTAVDLTRCPGCRQRRLQVVGLLHPGALPVPVWDTS